MARPSKTAVETTKAVGYIRVSTDKQAEHGVSLEAQQAKIEAYAQLYDVELVDIIIDAGVSAKTLERPGLQKALGMLRKGQANALLVAKLDRLTRSVKDLGTLVEGYFSSDRITLLSVADAIDTRTAAGRLVLNVLGSVAQWERETIGERTKEAMGHLRQQHQRTSLHAPYGFQIVADGKALVADAGEQALVAAIRDAKSRGLTQRQIVTDVARQGFTNRLGKPLTRTQVQRILAHIA
jgi:DNA invertase Pin-like site-specific DNA recombinase